MITKLTLEEKRYILECIVLDCYCPLSTFYENVRMEKGNLTAELEKAETRQDIKKIVNQYI